MTNDRYVEDLFISRLPQYYRGGRAVYMVYERSPWLQGYAKCILHSSVCSQSNFKHICKRLPLQNSFQRLYKFHILFSHEFLRQTEGNTTVYFAHISDTPCLHQVQMCPSWFTNLISASTIHQTFHTKLVPLISLSSWIHFHRHWVKIVIYRLIASFPFYSMCEFVFTCQIIIFSQ